MMRVKKTVKEFKEVEVIIEDYNVCDKCGQVINDHGNNQFECEFLHKTGNSYPEGGSGDQQEMELCQKCAVECVALLRANGYTVHDSEWDW